MSEIPDAALDQLAGYEWTIRHVVLEDEHVFAQGLDDLGEEGGGGDGGEGGTSLVSEEILRHDFATLADAPRGDAA